MKSLFVWFNTFQKSFTVRFIEGGYMLKSRCDTVMKNIDDFADTTRM